MVIWSSYTHISFEILQIKNSKNKKKNKFRKVKDTLAHNFFFLFILKAVKMGVLVLKVLLFFLLWPEKSALRSESLLERLGTATSLEILQSARCKRPNYTTPECAPTVFDRQTVRGFSTRNGVPRTQSTHALNIHCFSSFFVFFFSSPSRLHSSLTSLIGLIPCSLACPIIFQNIQGNVSSCCHFSYYNIQRGSWHSSFWKCFSFLSRSSVTHEGCGVFKGICSRQHSRAVDVAVGRLGRGWNDPPRICWIKSLHLDIIVLLLWRESLLPERDQISGPKMATCQRLATSPGNRILRQNTLLALDAY